MTKIYVVYYSMYGHVRTLAKAVKEGIDSVDGCEATMFQVRSHCQACDFVDHVVYFGARDASAVLYDTFCNKIG